MIIDIDNGSLLVAELTDSIWDEEIFGTQDNDTLEGGEGNDLLKGRKGDDILIGGMGNDALKGGKGDDILDGGEGDDVLNGGQGDDLLIGGMGNDLLKGGKGDDILDGGEGNDVLRGGQGNDLLIGGMGNDLLKGGKEDDILDGGEGNDVLRGGKGNDILIGGMGNDLLKGGKEDDTLNGGEGNDVLRGGQGNDLLISRSDAGEPEIAQLAEVNAIESAPLIDADDILIGGQGADTFYFEILLNAKVEIMEKHADDSGTINWRGVAGENDNVHDHWVEGIGNDVIRGFDRDAGDLIHIVGHTVDPTVVTDVDDNGREYSIINLISNQGGAGAHNGDKLGSISVYGDLVEASDLIVDGMAFAAVYDNINELL